MKHPEHKKTAGEVMAAIGECVICPQDTAEQKSQKVTDFLDIWDSEVAGDVLHSLGMELSGNFQCIVSGKVEASCIYRTPAGGPSGCMGCDVWLKSG